MEILQQSIWAPGITRSQRIAEGLTGYWPFWEGDGSTVMDVQGGKTGDFVNMAATDWQSKSIGPALDFDGAAHYIDVPNLPEPYIRPPCTLSVWFKVDVLPSTTANEYTLIRHATPGNNFQRHQIRIDDDDDKLAASVGNFVDFRSASAITIDTWHMATLVSTGNNAHQIHLDTEPGGTSVDAFPAITTPQLRFGVNFFAALIDYMLGQIASVGIWGRALPVDEISYLYGEGQHALTQRRLKPTLPASAGPPPAVVVTPHYYNSLMGGA